MERTTVLVVEDDARVARLIAEQLRDDDYDVVHARSTHEARLRLAERTAAAVVLDVGLPDGSGYDLCRQIRRGADGADPAVGILIVSGRVEEVDVLRGFERGADDYLRKPFAVPELLARVRALVARRRRSPSEVVHLGRLSIDVPHRRAQWGGQPLALSAKEFGLLLELASDPGAVRTKRDLLYRVWEFPGSVRTRTVDSHASRLRRKLIAAGAPRELVQNVWGEGYRLEVGRG